MYNFLSVLLLLITVFNKCQPQKLDPSLQKIDTATNWYPLGLLSYQLNSLAPQTLTKKEGEYFIQRCKDYNHTHKITTRFTTNVIIKKSMYDWAAFTTLPALFTLTSAYFLGLPFSDASELTKLLIGASSLPFWVGLYGKSVMTYNSLLNQNCLDKINLIQQYAAQD